FGFSGIAVLAFIQAGRSSLEGASPATSAASAAMSEGGATWGFFGSGAGAGAGAGASATVAFTSSGGAGGALSGRIWRIVSFGASATAASLEGGGASSAGISNHWRVEPRVPVTGTADAPAGRAFPQRGQLKARFA